MQIDALQIKRILQGFVAAALLGSCASPQVLSPHGLKRQLDSALSGSAVFGRSASGFILRDAQSGITLCDFHANRLFTPASNTKILTFHAALSLLPDTLPTFEWLADGDTLRFRGLGDPSFLHPRFETWAKRGGDFLARSPLALALCSSPIPLPRYGPAWAWDDYPYTYQCERGILPLYGHLARVSPGTERGSETQVWPTFFKDQFTPDLSLAARAPKRDELRNRWRYHPDSAWHNHQTPFLSDGLTTALLADTLKRSVTLSGSCPDSPGWRQFSACPKDTLLRLMMYESDNFIAEQLLIAAAFSRYGTPDEAQLIRYLRDTLWAARSNRPRWADGSGLSRYNLISPRYLSEALLDLWREMPRDSLLRFFPAGGRQGTIAERYSGPENAPFVWAKTGSMSGVCCLSGYIRTKRGKFLVFSFMHNNFTGPSTPWKDEMERLLRWIYFHY